MKNTMAELENSCIESFSIVGEEDMEWEEEDIIRYQSLPADKYCWIVVERNGKEIQRFNVNHVITKKWDNVNSNNVHFVNRIDKHKLGPPVYCSLSFIQHTQHTPTFSMSRLRIVSCKQLLHIIASNLSLKISMHEDSVIIENAETWAGLDDNYIGLLSSP